MKPTDFAVQLSNFLGTYLPSHRDLSVNTIQAYRDTFVLFLRFFRDVKKTPIERLRIEQIDAPALIEFLEYLEKKRRCTAQTRNQRLAAFHSFFRYLQTEEPERIAQCQRILSIPFKRHAHPSLIYLTAQQLQTILSQPDLTTRSGRRDAMLVSLLYDTGARVQELIDLCAGHVRLDAPAQIKLMGKGRKERPVPLMKATAELLKEYMRENGLDRPDNTGKPLFSNRCGGKLSRWGVRHILTKYVQQARKIRPGLPPGISPHSLRHSKAMHLLQSGTPLIIIRDFLGHVDVKTTEIYARVDIEMKRNALEKASDKVPSPSFPTWKKDKNLLDWLCSL